MDQYRVTQLTFGLGLQSVATRTLMIEQHLNEYGNKGWELVKYDKSIWEIPVVWRFVWKIK